MQQYYKNTLPISIAKYKAGAMNAVGLLFDYIKVKFRPDWKIVLKPKQVCNELSISNSTFYRALKKVGQLLGKVIHLRQEKAIPTSGTLIPTHETPSPTHETEIPTRGNNLPQTPSKTSSSSDTPDLNSDLFQSLSKSERDSFDKFAQDRVNELPRRPILPSKWIAANFDDLYQEWQHSKAEVQAGGNCAKQFQVWYDMMRRLGHVKGQKTKGGVQLVQNTSNEWHKYERLAQFWKLDYLKQCLGAK